MPFEKGDLNDLRKLISNFNETKEGKLIQEGFPHRDYTGSEKAEKMLDLFKKAFEKKED